MAQPCDAEQAALRWRSIWLQKSPHADFFAEFEPCHSDHFGSEKQFSEPFSLITAPQILRADDCFRQPFAYSILLDKSEFVHTTINNNPKTIKPHIANDIHFPAFANKSFLFLSAIKKAGMENSKE